MMVFKNTYIVLFCLFVPAYSAFTCRNLDSWHMFIEKGLKLCLKNLIYGYPESGGAGNPIKQRSEISPQLIQQFQLYFLCVEDIWSTCLSSNPVDMQSPTSQFKYRYLCARMEFQSSPSLFIRQATFHIRVASNVKVNVTFVKFRFPKTSTGCGNTHITVSN